MISNRRMLVGALAAASASVAFAYAGPEREAVPEPPMIGDWSGARHTRPKKPGTFKQKARQQAKRFKRARRSRRPAQ